MTGFVLNRRKVIGAALAGGAAFAFAPLAHAHRQKQGLTTIEWNARGKTLEVIHTLHLHDAEQALARLGILNKPDLSPLRARAKMAIYAQSKFKLARADGTAIALNIVGAEIDSTYVYIYQEAALGTMPDGFVIEDSLLQEVYPLHTNHVNVDLGTQIKSLTFSAGDKAKKVLA